MKKNILITGMSTFPFTGKLKENEYDYEGKTFSGIYQLDPVPQIVDTNLGDKGEKLDLIIGLCMTEDDPNNSMPLVKRDLEVEMPDNSKKTISPCTFFKEQTVGYLNRKDSDELEFQYIDVDPDNPENGIEQLINIVRNLRGTNGEDEIGLYLATYGGLRGLQQILESIIILLKNEGIEILDAYGSVSVKGKNKIISEKNRMKVFDFAFGINEFINFGKYDSLEKFIHNVNTSEESERLIGIIKKISCGIQMCDVMEFEEGLDELKKAKEQKEDQKLNGYLAIFRDTIFREYGNLLSDDRSTIDEIEWCIKKGYYQQALTLIEAKMTEDYEEKGIEKYSEEVAELGEKKSKDFCTKNYLYNKLVNTAVSKLYDKNSDNLGYLKIDCDFDSNNIEVSIPDNEDVKQLLMHHKVLKDLRNEASHYSYEKAKMDVEGLKLYVSEYIDRFRKIIDSAEDNKTICVNREDRREALGELLDKFADGKKVKNLKGNEWAFGNFELLRHNLEILEQEISKFKEYDTVEAYFADSNKPFFLIRIIKRLMKSNNDSDEKIIAKMNPMKPKECLRYLKQVGNETVWEKKGKVALCLTREIVYLDNNSYEK